MRVRLYLIAISLIMAQPSFAQDAGPARKPVAAAAGEEASAPSMELLEFLGEWEADDGEWIDPTDPDVMLLLGREYSDE